MPAFIALLLLSASARATLNLAIMDSGVDLRDPEIRHYVSEEQLRAIVVGGKSLWEKNLVQVQPHGLEVATRLLENLPPDRVRLIPIVSVARRDRKALMQFLMALTVLTVMPSRLRLRLAAVIFY